MYQVSQSQLLQLMYETQHCKLYLQGMDVFPHFVLQTRCMYVENSCLGFRIQARLEYNWLSPTKLQVQAVPTAKEKESQHGSKCIKD